MIDCCKNRIMSLWGYIKCSLCDRRAPRATAEHEMKMSRRNTMTDNDMALPRSDNTSNPTNNPTNYPSIEPTIEPTLEPTLEPTIYTWNYTDDPTSSPSANPTMSPTVSPTINTSMAPIQSTMITSMAPYNMSTAQTTLEPSKTKVDGAIIIICIWAVLLGLILVFFVTRMIISKFDDNVCIYIGVLKQYKKKLMQTIIKK